MTTDTVCVVCRGEKWLYSQKDMGALYGKPMTVRVSRVCPYCGGRGVAKPIPVYEREPERMENE